MKKIIYILIISLIIITGCGKSSEELSNNTNGEKAISKLYKVEMTIYSKENGGLTIPALKNKKLVIKANGKIDCTIYDFEKMYEMIAAGNTRKLYLSFEKEVTLYINNIYDVYNNNSDKKIGTVKILGVITEDEIAKEKQDYKDLVNSLNVPDIKVKGDVNSEFYMSVTSAFKTTSFSEPKMVYAGYIEQGSLKEGNIITLYSLNEKQDIKVERIDVFRAQPVAGVSVGVISGSDIEQKRGWVVAVDSSSNYKVTDKVEVKIDCFSFEDIKTNVDIKKNSNQKIIFGNQYVDVKLNLDRNLSNEMTTNGTMQMQSKFPVYVGERFYMIYGENKFKVASVEITKILD